jgi:squalene synthase HpnC
MTQDIFPWGEWPEEIITGVFSEEAALKFCVLKAKSHYENFPVVFSLLNKKQRDAAAAIYAFARAADDFADEAEFEHVRLGLLDSWEDQLVNCYNGHQITNPVFIALRWAIREFDLPQSDFSDLLSAFRQDCEKTRYQTYDELLEYCSRSANPVGRLMLRLWGAHSEKNCSRSDAICSGLQLANFWQDVSIDSRNNRIYLPAEDLEKYGVDEKSVLRGIPDGDFEGLMKLEIGRTRRLMKTGMPLIFHAGPQAMPYLGAVWAGGMTILSLCELNAKILGASRPKISLANLAFAVRKKTLLHNIIRSSDSAAMSVEEHD